MSPEFYTAAIDGNPVTYYVGEETVGDWISVTLPEPVEASTIFVLYHTKVLSFMNPLDTVAYDPTYDKDSSEFDNLTKNERYDHVVLSSVHAGTSTTPLNMLCTTSDSFADGAIDCQTDANVFTITQTAILNNPGYTMVAEWHIYTEVEISKLVVDVVIDPQIDNSCVPTTNFDP